MPKSHLTLEQIEAKLAGINRISPTISGVKCTTHSRSAMAENGFPNLPAIGGNEPGPDDQFFRVQGYAALYETPTTILDLGNKRYDEVISRNAFGSVLAQKPDVRFTVNHDPSKVLARSTNDTLKLSSDSKGLSFDAAVPAGLSYGQDLQIAMASGLIDGTSFRFAVNPGQVRTSVSKGVVLSRLDGFSNILDVSMATYPAYEGTTASLSQRSLITEYVEMRIAEGEPLEDAETETDEETETEENEETETKTDEENEEAETYADPAIDKNRASQLKLKAELDALELELLELDLDAEEA